MTAPAQRRRSSRRRADIVPVWATVVVVAALAARSGAEPTGIAVVDTVWLALFAGTVTLMTGWAPRWAWIVIADVALLAALGSPAAVLGSVALAIAVLSALTGRRRRAIGALVGALSSLSYLLAPTSLAPEAAGLAALVIVGVPLLSGAPKAPRAVRARLQAAIGVGITVTAVIGLALVLLLLDTRSSLVTAANDTEAAIRALRVGDTEGAASRLDASATSFARVRDRLGSWWIQPTRVVPGLAHQLDTIEIVADSGADVADAAIGIMDVGAADALKLTGGGLDLDIFDDLGEPLDAFEVELTASVERLHDADRSRLVGPLADGVDELAELLESAAVDLDLGREGVEVLPVLLGRDRPRHYFVAFVTPVEARGRTGFMGSFGEVIADDGRLELGTYGRTIEIDAFGGAAGRLSRTLSGPSDYLARYGRFDPQSRYRNVQMSPDFPSVAQVVAELYPQSGGQQIDGVISIDAYALAALLELTGPVRVPGLSFPLNGANAADFLLEEQYLAFQGDRGERVDFLEDVAQLVFAELTRLDVSNPRRLTRVLGPMVEGGHLVAWSADAGAQSFLERIGVSGRLDPVDGDFLAVTASNIAGNKIDLFLRREARYDVSVDPVTGVVDARLELTVHNDAPSSGLPPYFIENHVGAPPGTNRMFLSVYSPFTLLASERNGAAYPVEVGWELDRPVYSTVLELAPGDSETITFHFVGRLDPAGVYRLRLAHQPLVHPDEVEVTVTATVGSVIGMDGFETSDDASAATATLTMDVDHSLSARFAPAEAST